jgi:hypothetical protein
MNNPTSSMEDLARRLVAASQSSRGPHVHEAVAVSERLRISLTKFAGADGYTSLMRRALTLASENQACLELIKVGAGGRLEGFEQLDADLGSSVAQSECAVAIITHLLWLLDTFIGKHLTLKLVREAWPEVSLDE